MNIQLHNDKHVMHVIAEYLICEYYGKSLE